MVSELPQSPLAARFAGRQITAATTKVYQIRCRLRFIHRHLSGDSISCCEPCARTPPPYVLHLP
jgi:hypothetical protein